MPLRHNILRAIFVAAVLCGLAITTHAPAQVPALQPLDADIQQTSVSGVSSGAFMAVQFEVAHSSIVKGAGAIAGGPYFCAQGSLFTAATVCSCTAFQLLCRTGDGATDVTALVSATRRFERNGSIDATRHLANHRVYLFSGTLDTLIPPPVVRDLAEYYKGFMNQANVHLVADIKANHAMPTLSFGKTFVEHAGYNRWADTNDIIVLYPQAVATFTNPQGCWDWWGFDDANYAVKAGRQITAVRAMLDRIASGRH